MAVSDIITIVVIGIIGLAFTAFMVWMWINEKNRVIEWLKYAVSMAEVELGKYTGQLKLIRVYDWFVEKFPKFSALISFDTFSKWVDIALNTMNKWINAKNQIGTYIETGEIVTITKK